MFWTLTPSHIFKDRTQEFSTWETPHPVELAERVQGKEAPAVPQMNSLPFITAMLENVEPLLGCVFWFGLES